MYYDIEKAYAAGVESLMIGGMIENDSIYREKDVLEEDFTDPLISGCPEIKDIKKTDTALKDLGEDVFLVSFENKVGLFLTESELNAGLVKEDVYDFVCRSATRNEDDVMFTGCYEEARKFGEIFKRAMNNITPKSKQDSFFLVSKQGIREVL